MLLLACIFLVPLTVGALLYVRLRCPWCGQLVLHGLPRGYRVFCCNRCLERRPAAFCERCLSGTTPVTQELFLHTYSGVGDRVHLIWGGQRCAECGSRPCRVGFHLFGIWLGGGSAYRVVFQSGDVARGTLLLRSAASPTHKELITTGS